MFEKDDVGFVGRIKITPLQTMPLDIHPWPIDVVLVEDPINMRLKATNPCVHLRMLSQELHRMPLVIACRAGFRVHLTRLLMMHGRDGRRRRQYRHWNPPGEKGSQILPRQAFPKNQERRKFQNGRAEVEERRDLTGRAYILKREIWMTGHPLPHPATQWAHLGQRMVR
jgi:hypothetical protein